MGRPLPRTRAEFWRDKLAANKAHDARNRQKLRQLGWKVLVVWECQIRCNNMLKLAGRIKSFLAASG
jgi:DNA mismatch endonuclease (patch repair protein)